MNNAFFTLKPTDPLVREHCPLSKNQFEKIFFAGKRKIQESRDLIQSGEIFYGVGQPKDEALESAFRKYSLKTQFCMTRIVGMFICN